MQRDLEKVIELAKREQQKAGAYPYLPEIIELLQQIAQSLTQQDIIGVERRQKLFRGLARLVTEDFSFSESDLGTKILQCAERCSERKFQ